MTFLEGFAFLIELLEYADGSGLEGTSSFANGSDNSPSFRNRN